MRAERRRLARALGTLVVLALASAPLAAASPGWRPTAQENGAARIDLRERLEDVRFVRDGERLLVRAEVAGEERLVDAETWVRALDGAQRGQGSSSLLRLLNVSSAWGLIWVGVGFLGQALFTFRILLQWVTSEKAKRSVVPVGFWWSSLGGGVLLLAYFVWRRDVVGIVGQSTGVFVYARNLALIHGRRARIQRAGRERAAGLLGAQATRAT